MTVVVAPPDRARIGAGLVVPVGVSLAFTALMVLGRGQWFFLDEYDFLLGRDVSVDGLLRPHNEHLSFLPALEYRLLFAVFGMTTYAPYYAALVAVHLAAVGLAAALLRRSGLPSWVCAAAAVVLAFQAVGAQNVLWAFQTGFVGSLVFFLLAVHVLVSTVRGRLLLIAGCLLGSLACSGVGIAAVLGVMVGMLAARERWLDFVRVLALPGLVYGLWYVAFGRFADGPASSLTAAQTLERAPAFVFRAAAHGLGGLFTGDRGLGDGVGVVLVLLVVLLLGVVLATDRWLQVIPAACLGMAGALLASTALARVGLDPELARAGRYAYVTAVLLLVSVLVMLNGLAWPWSRRAVVLVGAALVLAVPVNISALRKAAAIEAANETGLRNRVEAVAEVTQRGPAIGILIDEAVDGRLAPRLRVSDVEDLRESDRLKARIADSSVEAAALTLVSTALTTGTPPPPTRVLALVRQDGVDVASGPGGCVTATSTGSDAGFVVVYVEEPVVVPFTAFEAATVRFYVGDGPDFLLGAYVDRPTTPGFEQSLSLAAPAAGRYLRVEASGRFELCGVR